MLLFSFISLAHSTFPPDRVSLLGGRKPNGTLAVLQQEFSQDPIHFYETNIKLYYYKYETYKFIIQKKIACIFQ